MNSDGDFEPVILEKATDEPHLLMEKKLEARINPDEIFSPEYHGGVSRLLLGTGSRCC